VSTPEVTVCVMTYNRPDFLAATLRSIFAQTWSDFRVVVLDNASTADYRNVLDEFGDRLVYLRHEVNLGVFGNFLFACRQFSDTPYLMIFHDDNLMHPQLIERQLKVLNEHTDICWITCLLQVFFGQVPQFDRKISGQVLTFGSMGELAHAMICGLQLSFGPVLYRTSALHGIDIDALFDECSIIADRPILFHAMKNGRSAVLNDRLELYREHATRQSYVGPLQAKHLIGLARQYRLALQDGSTPIQRWRWRFWCAFNLPDSYLRLFPAEGPGFIKFLRECVRAGVLDFWLLPWFPARRGLGLFLQGMRGQRIPSE
jgi:glycosyltransferase involved in cell wall biosynthesis